MRVDFSSSRPCIEDYSARCRVAFMTFFVLTSCRPTRRDVKAPVSELAIERETCVLVRDGLFESSECPELEVLVRRSETRS